MELRYPCGTASHCFYKVSRFEPRIEVEYTLARSELDKLYFIVDMAHDLVDHCSTMASLQLLTKLELLANVRGATEKEATEAFFERLVDAMIHLKYMCQQLCDERVDYICKNMIETLRRLRPRFVKTVYADADRMVGLGAEAASVLCEKLGTCHVSLEFDEEEGPVFFTHFSGTHPLEAKISEFVKALAAIVNSVDVVENVRRAKRLAAELAEERLAMLAPCRGDYDIRGDVPPDPRLAVLAHAAAMVHAASAEFELVVAAHRARGVFGTAWIEDGKVCFNVESDDVRDVLDAASKMYGIRLPCIELRTLDDYVKAALVLTILSDGFTPEWGLDELHTAWKEVQEAVTWCIS